MKKIYKNTLLVNGSAEIAALATSGISSTLLSPQTTINETLRYLVWK